MLILASASPRRKELLARLRIDFEAIPAEVEELDDAPQGPSFLVRENASRKGRLLAERFPERPVLAADTTVEIEGQILNKPADLDEARSMLRRLSGQWHTVHTALVFHWVERDAEEVLVIGSRVHFRDLDDRTIDAYFAIVNPLDKAGAYGIQEGRELIIDSREGSLTNIMGLPLEETRELLERQGLLVAV